jgi:predicted DNA binding CopG/RHH family protein
MNGGHGGRRPGAGRPNPWSEKLRKVTVRLPESIYEIIKKRSEKRGTDFSYALVEILDRLRKYM